MDRSLHRRGAANATGSFSSACCGPAGCGPPLRLVPDEGGGFCGADAGANRENTSSSERAGHGGGRARGRGGLPYLEPYKAPLKALSDVPSPGGRGGEIIIKQHLHRDFVYKALSQGREAPGWPCGILAGRPRPGPRVGAAPSPARNCGRGEQSSIHPATSGSSGFHPLFPLSHEEQSSLAQGLSFRPEKGCQTSQREGLAGTRWEGRRRRWG